MPAMRRPVLPGFRLTLAVTFGYLVLIVGLPLGALAAKALSIGWSAFIQAVGTSRALAAYRVSFGAAFVAAIVDVAAGFVIAWALARGRFPGRGLVDAIVDLPFALPTAVAGIALTTLYAPTGWFGRLVHARIAFAWPGIVIALAFVGLPLVVRTVQPILLDLDPALEEAAATLGASRFRTFFSVLLPACAPALVAGFALAFARALGEYGSIVFISGNLPMRTEIAPVLIVAKLEQYDYAGATSIALVLLLTSFVLLLALNIIERRFLARGRT
jgi:sulfate transport system permease protein